MAKGNRAQCKSSIGNTGQMCVRPKDGVSVTDSQCRSMLLLPEEIKEVHQYRDCQLA